MQDATTGNVDVIWKTRGDHLSANDDATQNYHSPDLAASSTPNGLIRLKNASTLELFAVNSTMQLFSATSTTRPPNWSARVLIALRCRFLAMSASLADTPPEI
jgi:hypothetical protein